MDNSMISLNQALRMITAKIGDVRVPVWERGIAAELETIAGELMEVVAAIEADAAGKAAGPEAAGAEPEREGGEEGDV